MGRKSTPKSTPRPTYNVELGKVIKSGEYRGRYPVYVRVSITVNGRSIPKRHGTEVYIEKKEWVPKARYGRWIRAGVTANKAIEDKINELKAQEGISDSNLFFDFANNYLAISRKTIAAGTWLLIKRTVKNFKEYAGKDLLFEDVKKSLIDGYITFMKGKGNKSSTINTKLGALRMVVKSSEKYYNKLAAFTGQNQRKVKSKKQHLEMDELDEFSNYAFKPSYKEIADFFAFSVYCWGMRASDAILFKVGMVNKGSYAYSMKKTEDKMDIQLIPKAIEIYERYSAGKSPDEYLFSFYDKTKISEDDPELSEHLMLEAVVGSIDRKLKRMCKIVGMNKNITTHSCRHTWARMADKTGVDRRVIQKALGHEVLATTEDYLDELAFDEVDELNKSLFG